MYLPYVYRVTNNITNQFYYGIRSKNVKLQLTPEDDFWSNNMKLATISKSIISKYQSAIYDTIIICSNPSKEQCKASMNKLIDQEVNNQLCMNVIITGTTIKSCIGCTDTFICKLSDDKKFCTHACSASYNNLLRSVSSRKAQSETLKATMIAKFGDKTKKIIKQKENPKCIVVKPKLCICCGAPDKTDCCILPKSHQTYKSLNKWFNLPLHDTGSQLFVEQLTDLQTRLQSEYLTSSIPSMAKIYGHTNVGNFSKILKSIGIKFRTQSEAQKECIFRGERTTPCNTRFKTGRIQHNDISIYYRSSYEERIYNELIYHSFQFEVENLRVKYYDSIRQSDRIAIPDIVTPNNQIVEIKSDWTYHQENMLDKCKAYTALDYSVFMIKEFILFEYDHGSLSFIEKTETYLSIFK